MVFHRQEPNSARQPQTRVDPGAGAHLLGALLLLHLTHTQSGSAWRRQGATRLGGCPVSDARHLRIVVVHHLLRALPHHAAVPPAGPHSARQTQAHHALPVAAPGFRCRKPHPDKHHESADDDEICVGHPAHVPLPLRARLMLQTLFPQGSHAHARIGDRGEFPHRGSLLCVHVLARPTRQGRELSDSHDGLIAVDVDRCWRLFAVRTVALA